MLKKGKEGRRESLLSNKEISFVVLEEFVEFENVGVVHLFQNVDFTQKFLSFVLL